jgi:hypothetical protein
MYPERNYEMKENEDLDASEVDSHRSEDSNEVKHKILFNVSRKE